ncbi:hypothetical protein ACJ73_02783 [Blastomyces percursus]|uniref:Ferric reductase NAD binding domain-containing protein n=1 Tax=Blastomyces percursus TaxID=1658174 RepID=A0A1J9RBE5_9EURO|nr:hypothetical protein ACJ73_02783 [Blastomyces percursus]
MHQNSQIIKLMRRNFRHGQLFARNDTPDIVLSNIKASKIHVGQLVHKRIKHSTADKGDFTQILHHYNCIVMFATGIGITAQIPFIKKVMESRSRWKPPTRRLLVVWEIDHYDQFSWVFDKVQELLNRDQGNYSLHISVYLSNPTDYNGIFISPRRLNVSWLLHEKLSLCRGRILVAVAARRSVRNAVRIGGLDHLSSLKDRNISKRLQKDIKMEILLMVKVMKAFVRSAESIQQDDSPIWLVEAKINGLLHSIESVWKALALPRGRSDEHVQAIDIREFSFQPD